MVKYTIFDKARDEPFPLSRTGIDEYLRDPRPFVLKRKFGVKFPSIPPFTLAIATYHLLKNEFNNCRDNQSSEHWIFKKYNLAVVPYKHPEIEIWRNNFKGIRYTDEASNLQIFGAIDDVWQDLISKQLYIVDYKSTSKKDNPTIESGWGATYKRQMEVYQWLFRKNNLPVSDLGYFLYVNGLKGDRIFYRDHAESEHIGFMEFATTLIPYVGNSDWVADTLLDIKEALMSDNLPEPNPNHDLNSYYYERLRVEAENN